MSSLVDAAASALIRRVVQAQQHKASEPSRACGKNIPPKINKSLKQSGKGYSSLCSLQKESHTGLLDRTDRLY